MQLALGEDNDDKTLMRALPVEEGSSAIVLMAADWSLSICELMETD